MSITWASKEAKKSKHGQHKLGAVVVHGSRILSAGCNAMRPSAIIGTSTLHAEAAAILKLLKARRQHELIGADIYVSRFTRGGHIGLAKPCPACASLIKSVGIRRVFFTTNSGGTESYNT